MPTLDNLIAFIIDFINRFVVPGIFAIAFVVFLWGLYLYFIQGGADEEKRQEGRKLALYGFLGLFLMVSVWGIVNMFVYTFGFEGAPAPVFPRVGG